ncbi:asparaginase [Ponticoccus sp. (in: a-proteobacteria)]|uniref:asparaginase n=1 Tax=Ponticoccus sp. (in: a-proteobacteria) TaxID=1925025 RepID=UPI003AB24652
MTGPHPMVEIHRGGFVESRHGGHAVVCDSGGTIVEAWGDPDAVILPRSAAKMLQALPLVASGAARAAGLGPRQLALACASHQGAPLHVAEVGTWLERLGLRAEDLRCGPEPSRDKTLRFEMIRTGQRPGRIHNNCSGKHTGFLTLARHLGTGPDYVAPEHPVQRACRAHFEDMTGAPSPGFGIDGCSAPNFATTVAGLARAMARMAGAAGRAGAAEQASAALVEAMIAHPDLVAGEGRACTLLMRAASEPVAIKTGAEGVFVAILPQRGLGLALKIADGATRASECAVAALLVRLGVLEAGHPDVARFLNPPIRNWDGQVTGEIRTADRFG